MGDKVRLWFEIAWKYILLGIVVAAGILATVFLVKYLSPGSGESITEKIGEINDQIDKNKKLLRDYDKYRHDRDGV